MPGNTLRQTGRSQTSGWAGDSIILLLLFCGLALFFITPVQSASVYPFGEPSLSATVEGDSRLDPGTSYDLTIVMENTALDPEQIQETGAYIYNPVSAIGTTVTLFPGDAPVDITNTPLVVGYLPPEVRIPVKFSLIVPEDAHAGDYTMNLQAAYMFVETETQGSNPQYIYRSGDATIPIPIQIRPRVRVEAQGVSTSNVVPGQEGSVTVTLRNVGYETGTHASAQLYTDTISPITPYEGSAYLGTFSPGDTRTVSWRVSVSDRINATVLPAVVLVNYQDNDGVITSSKPLTIGIPVSQGPKFAVRYAPVMIYPGGTSQLNVTYINTGDVPAYDADAKITLVSPLISAESIVALGDILPGQEANAIFSISLDSNAIVKPYAILTDVRYRDGNGVLQLSDLLKINVETKKPGISGYLLSPPVIIAIIGVILIVAYHLSNRSRKKGGP
jgi:hypothetical protein